METCSVHEYFLSVVEKMDKKIDIISERQIILIEDTTHVKDALDNGLRKEIQEAHEEVINLNKKLDLAVDKISTKYQGVEEFKWFRDLANNFRNNLFINTLKLAFMGILVLLLLHFGDTLVKGLLKSM
jgi:hypothetical protein